MAMDCKPGASSMSPMLSRQLSTWQTIRMPWVRYLILRSTEEISIEKLAQTIIMLTESQSSIHYIPYDEAYAPGFEDMRRRVPSIEKISRLIGFKPRYNLNQTLSHVIEYEREQFDRDTAKDSRDPSLG